MGVSLVEKGKHHIQFPVDGMDSKGVSMRGSLPIGDVLRPVAVKRCSHSEIRDPAPVTIESRSRLFERASRVPVSVEKLEVVYPYFHYGVVATLPLPRIGVLRINGQAGVKCRTDGQGQARSPGRDRATYPDASDSRGLRHHRVTYWRARMLNA